MCVPAGSPDGDGGPSGTVANEPVFGTAIVAAGDAVDRTAMVRPLFGLATRARHGVRRRLP